MKYSIKVIENDNSTYYLSSRNKTAWCLRTAKKHAEEFWVNVGLTVIVEDQFGDCKAQFGW
jgi:hypothetical protein